MFEYPIIMFASVQVSYKHIGECSSVKNLKVDIGLGKGKKKSENWNSL